MTTLDELAGNDPKMQERLRKAEGAPDAPPRPRLQVVASAVADGPAPVRVGRSVRQLATIWADDIEISLDTGGVVDGLMPRTGLTVLYGDSNTGKTFAAIDLACHVAAGLPWRDKDVEQGAVVYVAAEAPESVKRRLWAWKRHHEVEHLPVVVVQSSVDMLGDDREALVALVAQVARERGRVALVVVDTLARSMVGNENAPEDMGRFVAACADLRDAGETHVLVVHHCGKDAARGARGHSSLRAATDVELEVTQLEDGSRCIAVTKSRDEEGGSRFGFKLNVMELGTNAKGRTIATCVAAAAETPAETAKELPLTPKQRTTLRCLSTAIMDHGEQLPGEPGMPRNTLGVSFAKWREVTLRHLASGEEEWRRRADFKRTVQALQAKGLVQHVDEWCWSNNTGVQAAAHIVAAAKEKRGAEA